MNPKKPSLLDWILYFGSQDERNQRGADRAGHLAFYTAYAVAAVDFFVRLDPTGPDLASIFLPVAADLLIVFVAGGVYLVQWVRQGLTLADSSLQKRVLRWMAPLAGLVTAVILAIQYHAAMGWGGAVVASLAGAGVAWGLTAFLLRRLERASARRQNP